MRKTISILLILPAFLSACMVFPDVDDPTNPDLSTGYGILELNFELPDYQIPDKNLHRISLNFSTDVEALYRGEYFHKENVSDFKQIYEIKFPVGEYYYEAAITCSCLGDTCLNGGFPGGRYGMKYTTDKFLILDQERTEVKTIFE